MSFDIIIGRSKKDVEKHGTEGTIFVGKQYVHMGQVTSLANRVFLDVASSHVVFVVGKRGSGKCVHEDTIITLVDGRQKAIRELEQDTQGIFSLDQNFKMQQAQKSEFHKRPAAKLISIVFRSGREIKLTPEHPLLTVKGWMPAEQLHIGSRIATPRKIEAFGDGFLKEAEVKLLAYFIAEGHLSNGFVLFSNMDPKINDDFVAAVKEFDPNLDVCMHSKEGCYRVAERRIRKVIDGGRDDKGRFVKPIFDGKSSIRKWLDNVGIYGQLSAQKMVPDIVFTLPKNKLALFLNRLFSSDGSIYKDRSRYWEIVYCSISKKLALQVQHLLLRFGIVSKLRTKKYKEWISYEIVIGGEHVQTFLQEIGFFGDKEMRVAEALKEAPTIIRNPNVDTIPKEIWDIYKPDSWAEIGRKLHYSIPKSFRESARYAPSRQKLLQIARADDQELLEMLATSDIFWDEITGIELLEGEFTVYDLTVPEHHNFVANDIIVHNSYSMGVIAEGITMLPDNVKQNLSVILLDTMGVYWTMKYPNNEDAQLIRDWKMESQGLDVKIFAPHGFYNKLKEDGVPADAPFALRPADLNPEDWCLTFGIDQNSDAGVLISRVLNAARAKKKEYDIPDLMTAVEEDKKSERAIQNVVYSHFGRVTGWGIFSTEGTPLNELAVGGQVTVLDMSVYATLPSGWLIRALVIGLIAKKLFTQRMLARKNEELSTIDQAVHYFSKEKTQKLGQPLVWLIVDEAHEVLPKDEKTAATSALVTILREGRQPGISLILASQQPGKIHTDVITQSDIVLAHRLTAQTDAEALGQLTQTYMREGLLQQLDTLPRAKGSAVIFDDQNERVFAVSIRPRLTWHGGSSPTALVGEKTI